MDVKKKNIGLRRALCALALLVVAPASFAQRPHSTAADSPEWNLSAKDKVLNALSNLIEDRAYVPGVDFSKWSEVIAKIKPDAEKAKTQEEFANVVNIGLHDAFNISHIVLMPPVAVENRVRHEMVGIGIRIAERNPEGIVVASTVPDAPAQKAGIEPGDTIMEADGHHVDGPTYITGEVGTSVSLKVKKMDGTVKTYKLVRAKFNTAQKEELNWIDSDTAVIKITTFDLSYSRQNVEDLMQKAAKAKNLLVDLRNNGGGAVTNMMNFLSTVLDRGTDIGTFISKQSVDSFVELKHGDKNDLKAIADFSPSKLTVGGGSVPVYKGHIAVLVNPGSGSASEITAEALKEKLGAPIVGERSAGAVLVSVMGDLPHNFNLQYPISDYISSKGVRLEANGIIPDKKVQDVPFVKPGQTDPVYLAAETLLNSAARNGN